MKKRFPLQIILFPLVFLCLSFESIAQNEKAEARIDSVMKQFDMMGLSVAVVKKGEIIYAHSFGFKNKETNTLLGNSDIFRIASISKSFSATSIMQLVEAKKLSLKEFLIILLNTLSLGKHIL